MCVRWGFADIVLVGLFVRGRWINWRQGSKRLRGRKRKRGKEGGTSRRPSDDGFDRDFLNQKL